MLGITRSKVKYINCLSAFLFYVFQFLAPTPDSSLQRPICACCVCGCLFVFLVDFAYFIQCKPLFSYHVFWDATFPYHVFFPLLGKRKEVGLAYNLSYISQTAMNNCTIIQFGDLPIKQWRNSNRTATLNKHQTNPTLTEPYLNISKP